MSDDTAPDAGADEVTDLGTEPQLEPGSEPAPSAETDPSDLVDDAAEAALSRARAAAR